MTTLWRSILNAVGLAIVIVLICALPGFAKSLLVAIIVVAIAQTFWKSATGEPPDSAAE